MPVDKPILKIPDKYNVLPIVTNFSMQIMDIYDLAKDPTTGSAIGIVDRKTGRKGYLTNDMDLVTHAEMMQHGDEGLPPVHPPGKLPQ